MGLASANPLYAVTWLGDGWVRLRKAVFAMCLGLSQQFFEVTPSARVVEMTAETTLNPDVVVRASRMARRTPVTLTAECAEVRHQPQAGAVGGGGGGAGDDAMMLFGAGCANVRAPGQESMPTPPRGGDRNS